MTDVELGEEDVGDIELTDVKSAIEARNRFNDLVLEPGMITIEQKDKKVIGNKSKQNMAANSITEYNDCELLIENSLSM